MKNLLFSLIVVIPLIAQSQKRALQKWQNNNQFERAVTSINIADSSTFFITAGNFYRTDDTGETWHQTPSFPIKRMCFPIKTHGFASHYGAPRVRTTKDGGKTWQEKSVSAVSEISDLLFIDTLHGWVISPNDGEIGSTVDGGKTWTQALSPTRHLLNSIAFSDKLNGWAIGEEGTIITTKDGGRNWTSQNSGTNKFLYNICMLNQKKGFITGQNGIILTTEDGGIHWKNIHSPTNKQLYAIDFHKNMGIIVGQGGTLLVSVDAGKSWEFIETNTTEDFLSLDILTESSIWIGSREGQFFQYVQADITTKIQEKQLAKINIYPNPNNGQFKIQGLLNKNYHYSLYNPNGQIIQKTKARSNDWVTIPQKNTGVYWLALQDEKGNKTSYPIIVH